MNIFRLSRNYRNIARLVKIVTIVGKYGFSAFLFRIRAGLGVVPAKVFDIKQEKSLKGIGAPQRVRMAAEELGPTFVKMGQILSLRPDIIPSHYARELEKLQDRTPVIDFPKIQQVIQEEYGFELDQVFKSIDPEPVASGSIAQVHRAVLKSSGEEVAVKVLKPETRKIVETDLSIIQHLARLAVHYIPEIRAYNPLQVVQEFSDILMNELNLLKEAHNIQRFSQFFKSEEYVHIPDIYMEYTTGRVMVMEYIQGVKINDEKKIDEQGLDRKKIAENGARMALKEIFEFGFFHADPHPGNIFILPENVLAHIDFGITGYLDQRDAEVIGNILLGLVERDVDRIVRYLRRYDFIGEQVNLRKLKIDLYDLIDSTQNTTLSSINVSSTIHAVFWVTRKYRIQFPGEYFLIFKTLLQVDGVGRMLYPEFNITDSARPHVRKWFLRNYSPQRYLKSLLYILEDLDYFVRTVPVDLSSSLKRMIFGKLRVPIYHENLDRAVSELDRTGNRISFSVIIAALLLSSSILVQAQVGPTIAGYPILGYGGFFTAAVMGLWLLVGIIRSGKL
ncbi:MAG: ABC1 kinase family protein [Spirochaetota bacterium]